MIGTYLTDSVDWVQHAGADQWGEPLAPTVESIPARIKRETKLVRNFAGEEVVAAGSVLLRQRPDHRDTLRFDGVDHSILQISEARAFQVSHYEVFVA